MADNKHSLLRIYTFSTLISLALVIFVGVNSGISALFLVLVLAILEITFSFDNAVINAKILQRMSPGWQQAFMSIGIIIAVFGVRIILPIAMVAIATGSGFGQIVDLALHHSKEYGERLQDAHALIAGFGSIFLLMLFLNFIFEDREIKWLKKTEAALARVGKLKGLSIVIALFAICVGILIAPDDKRQTVLLAGFTGLAIYSLINWVDKILTKRGEEGLRQQVKKTFKTGLIAFIYLEIIDASFSLDGVVGAFSITNKVLLIGVGLGIGALYVRTLTVHMLRRGTLSRYIYLDHGAHYAIGILAILMLLSLRYEIPEAVTGLSGFSVIAIAVTHSYLEAKKAKII